MNYPKDLVHRGEHAREMEALKLKVNQLKQQISVIRTELPNCVEEVQALVVDIKKRHDDQLDAMGQQLIKHELDMQEVDDRAQEANRNNREEIQALKRSSQAIQEEKRQLAESLETAKAELAAVQNRVERLEQAPAEVNLGRRGRNTTGSFRGLDEFNNPVLDEETIALLDSTPDHWARVLGHPITQSLGNASLEERQAFAERLSDLHAINSHWGFVFTVFDHTVQGATAGRGNKASVMTNVTGVLGMCVRPGSGGSQRWPRGEYGLIKALGLGKARPGWSSCVVIGRDGRRIKKGFFVRRLPEGSVQQPVNPQPSGDT